MRRPALPLLLVSAAAVLGLGLATAGGSAIESRTAASTRLLGITGNVERFEQQTGQRSQVVQAFLGWGQGQSFGAPLPVLIPRLAPVPMLHLGTGGGSRNRREVITPGAIAAGQGDGYLIAINQAVAGWGKGIYVRPMAEMNNAAVFYSGYRANGQPKDALHSPESYRRAFARIYLILHGGSAAAINARLRALGLPALRGGDLPANPFPRLRVLWSPLASSNPRVPGNAPERYYPGAAYVDVEGADIYDERLTDTAPWPGLEQLYRLALSHGKPFSVPEWGLIGVDDPAFVRHMCTFAKTHPATEALVYFESRPGSVFDLGTKPASRAAYRQCLTPLAGNLPDWAGGAPPAEAVRLTLTPNPPSGAAPLAATFAIDARLTVPIVQWQLFFGDGTETGGAGQPPSALPHAYAADGLYHATLIVYAGPPFDPVTARFLVSADVAVGTNPQPLVSFRASPGRSPLAVTFQTDLRLPQEPTGWQIAFGDARSNQGEGRPPHFAGHTYPRPGTFRAVLVVQTPTGRLVTFTDVVVTQVTPPASGTPTGTVLVNGSAFTGGPIPYGSRIDVTNGTLQLRTDTGTLLVYGAGVPAAFRLLRGRDQGRPIVELRLVGGNFGACKRKTAASSRGAAPKKPIRQLWGKGKGRFRTHGRFVSATVRGTFWLTADRCDGSLVRVREGVLQVDDLVRRTRVLVRAGKSYLARRP